MFRLIATAVFVGLATLPSQSGQKEVCYSATYDKAHLEKYPGQTPTSLNVLLYRQDGNLIFSITATLRGEKGKWGEAGGCFTEGDVLKCSVDCDGGGFELKPTATDVTLKNSRGFRLTQESCNGEAKIHMVEAVPGNRKFTLQKSERSACND